MDGSAALRALPIIAAMFLTPLVMRLWRYLFPPRASSAFDDFDDLRRRNRWIDAACFPIGIVGVSLPLIVFGFGRRINDVGWPALGLAFGGAVILPCIWICIATLPFGLTRFYEYWRFYVVRYQVGMIGILAIYVPLALFGTVSVIELFRRGIW